MNVTDDRHTPGTISEDHLKQMALNGAMAELGLLSAGVVHELNAPLSVIVSAAQMILREEDVSEFVREMVERIGSEAQRLSQLTRVLLNFNNLEETGGVTDVNLAVDFMLDFLACEASRRGITTLRDLDFHLPLIPVGGNLLRQILLNIMMNAIQAMECGGRLLVETLAKQSGEVSIVITDTGSGIPEELLGRIFEPYFTTKKPGEGTGLGLFVTKTLVENGGGRITVRSRPGGGTTFTVTFLSGEE